MRTSRSTIFLTLIISGLLLLVPATGDATPPRKGVHYSGTITSQQGSEKLFVFKLSFYVSARGNEVGPFVFSEGAPFGEGCAEGPLGEPAANRHATIEGGSFEASFPLELDDPEELSELELGSVHLEGHFAPRGVFVGQLQNRTMAKACRGSWTFKLHAQSR